MPRLFLVGAFLISLENLNNMANKLITIPDYCKTIKKVSRQAVLKAIKNKKPHLLPNVVNITKLGRDYLLEVTL